MLNLRFSNSPFKIIVFFYLLFVLIFTILFSLPVSTNKDIPLIDAFFLAVSGISITGLSTFDLNSTLTITGKVFLLLAIQFGGIGIMVILGSFLMVFTKNLSLFQQTLLSFDTNQFSLKSIKKLTLFIFLYTFLIEGVASLIFYSYIKINPNFLDDTVFLSIFHAISSFTNSGFDLFEGGLANFSDDGFFLIGTSLLIILGSIGFPSVLELAIKKGKKLSLYTKINLIMHSVLLSLGTIIFFVLEYDRSFNNFNLSEKIYNSFFLSSTTRNGGLSSLPVVDFSETTILIILILMFIGGSASSCGGGIRVTTLFVVLARAFNTIKGRNDVIVFKKTLYQEEVNKAHLIFFSFIGLFFTSVLVLSFVENIKINHLIFEIMSALTTTGLSFGVTDQLSNFSLIWLCVLMIIGRIGIIALVYSLMKPRNSSIKYPKEHIIVG